jgi:hypothetical protein
MVGMVVESEEADEPPPMNAGQVPANSSLDVENIEDYITKLEPLYIKNEEEENSLAAFFDRESVITSYEQELIKGLIEDVEAYRFAAYELEGVEYNPDREEDKDTFLDYDDCFLEYWVDKTPTLELDYVNMVKEDDWDGSKVVKKFFTAIEQNALRTELDAYLGTRKYVAG